MVELLMTSVIVTMAGVLLAAGLVAANRHAEQRATQALTTQLLAGQLALLSDAVGPQPRQQGTFSSSADKFRWTVEWSEETAPPLAPLAKTTVAVTYQDRTTDVVTYRPIAEP